MIFVVLGTFKIKVYFMMMIYLCVNSNLNLLALTDILMSKFTTADENEIKEMNENASRKSGKDEDNDIYVDNVPHMRKKKDTYQSLKTG